MTDTPSSPTDPTDDTLLASLYLDGEATAEERARVEGDPQLMAQVDAFRRIADDLANVTPPADLARTQIAAALDLFDEQHGAAPAAASSEAPAPASVSSLADRREKKAARGIPTWLSAAAALALVVGGIGFVASRSDDGADETASVASDEVSPSAADRSTDDSGANESMLQAEAVEEEAMEDDAMEAETAADFADDDAMEDSAAEDDAMEEDAMEDDAMADDSGEGSDDAAPVPEDERFDPILLDDFPATTAAGYLEFIDTERPLPLAESPCATSPVVQGLEGFDSFIPVVFDNELASLLLQADDPTVAVIVGQTCEIELR